MTGRAGEPTGAGTGAGRSAWHSPRAWAVLLVATALLLAIDLVSKDIAFRRIAGAPVTVLRADVLAGGPLYRLIPPHEPVVVIPRVLEFTLVLNPGAVFGLGAGQRVMFIVFTVGAFGFALWMFRAWTGPRDHIAHLGLALLLSGGLGNLYDRILLGCVRDFIHPLPRVVLPFNWSYPWSSGAAAREVWPYVSNLADLFLIFGIVLLVAHTWRSGGAAAPGSRTPSAADAAQPGRASDPPGTQPGAGAASSTPPSPRP